MNIKWMYRGSEINGHADFDDDIIGFVYVITYTNGASYCGKKMIRSMRRLKPTKEQLSIRKNYKRVEIKNMPFLKYNGSSKNTDELEIQRKDIIELCTSKIDLTYCETKWLFKFDVLFNDRFINDCIGGKFFDGKISEGLSQY